MYEHNAPGLVRAEAKFANQWLAGDFAIGGAFVCGRWLTGRASDFETAVEEFAVRDCSVQRRRTEIVERLSRGSQRDLSGATLETIFADRHRFAECV